MLATHPGSHWGSLPRATAESVVAGALAGKRKNAKSKWVWPIGWLVKLSLVYAMHARAPTRQLAGEA